MKTPTVLVIDDDVPVRRAIWRLLQQEGFEVLEANGGAEALAMLSDGRHVDAVTCDLSMPSMHGAQVLEALRRDWPALPVVIVSGSLTDELAAELLDAGAAACLDKLDLAALIPVVRDALVGARLRTGG